MVLLEAMACQLPVIGSNIWWNTRYYSRQSDGIIIASKRCIKTIKSKRGVIQNEDLRKNLTNNGYKMVNERFGWETIAQKYIKL